MRIYALFALAAALFWAILPGSRAAPRWRRLLADVVLAAILVGFGFLFLSQNGFIGPSDIQSYPY
jgi:hypothetical protein